MSRSMIAVLVCTLTVASMLENLPFTKAQESSDDLGDAKAAGRWEDG